WPTAELAIGLGCLALSPAWKSRQENERDICVIKVPPEMKYTDYFVIGNGISIRYLHVMAYLVHCEMYKCLRCKNFILGIEDDTSSLSPAEFEYE
ncbi:hypothetical protein E2I00_009735, partial [Balaenoptera physalus]